MRHYPRVWNRIFIFLVGLFLLLGGLGVALATLWPWFRQQWSHYMQVAVDSVFAWLPVTAVAGKNISWLCVVAIALGVLFALVSLLTIFTQRGGRTRHTLSFESPAADGEGTLGSTTITTKFISQYVQDRLQDDINISSVNVSSWKVKRRNGLLLHVKLVAGASPLEAYRRLDSLTSDLDTLLGQNLPLMVRFSSGGALAKTLQSTPRVL
ncbi:hypothetical protein KRX54_01880 [Actinomycetaceae bacterium TAE3-ERU4]|nr:hypothetical protein [Actinomycetaceae bacterium TAE3-ERU4]